MVSSFRTPFKFDYGDSVQTIVWSMTSKYWERSQGCKFKCTPAEKKRLFFHCAEITLYLHCEFATWREMNSISKLFHTNFSNSKIYIVEVFDSNENINERWWRWKISQVSCLCREEQLVEMKAVHVPLRMTRSSKATVKCKSCRNSTST